MQRRVTSASSNYTRLTQSYNFVSKVKCFKFILLRNGVDTAGHIYSYFNLRCRFKASSLQDKTEGEYGILMNTYQQN